MLALMFLLVQMLYLNLIPAPKQLMVLPVALARWHFLWWQMRRCLKTFQIHLQSLEGAPLRQLVDLLNLEVTRDKSKVRGNLRAKTTVPWVLKIKKVSTKNVLHQGNKDFTMELS
jgi:hypothetical protein